MTEISPVAAGAETGPVTAILVVVAGLVAETGLEIGILHVRRAPEARASRMTASLVMDPHLSVKIVPLTTALTIKMKIKRIR